MADREPKCKSDPRIIELAEALKTLADPNRLRIMCFSREEKAVPVILKRSSESPSS